MLTARINLDELAKEIIFLYAVANKVDSGVNS